jgi:hypothetical protein
MHEAADSVVGSVVEKEGCQGLPGGGGVGGGVDSCSRGGVDGIQNGPAAEHSSDKPAVPGPACGARDDTLPKRAFIPLQHNDSGLSECETPVALSGWEGPPSTPGGWGVGLEEGGFQTVSRSSNSGGRRGGRAGAGGRGMDGGGGSGGGGGGGGGGMRMVVLVGIPGSGKSFVANRCVCCVCMCVWRERDRERERERERASERERERARERECVCACVRVRL